MIVVQAFAALIGRLFKFSLLVTIVLVVADRQPTVHQWTNKSGGPLVLLGVVLLGYIAFRLDSVTWQPSRFTPVVQRKLYSTMTSGGAYMAAKASSHLDSINERESVRRRFMREGFAAHNFGGDLYSDGVYRKGGFQESDLKPMHRYPTDR